jgi:hypothetical protein
MKRLLASVVLIVAAATLSGCYYDPGYSYVRGSGYAGDAYYGDGGNAYYAAPAYYGGYYGCCYAPGVSVGVSSVWYGGSRYRHDDYRYRDHRDYRGHAGQWQGHGGDRGDHRGDRRDDHRDGNPQRRDRHDRDDRR